MNIPPVPPRSKAEAMADLRKTCEKIRASNKIERERLLKDPVAAASLADSDALIAQVKSMVKEKRQG